MAKKYKNYNVNANIEGNLKLQKTEANTDDNYEVLVVNKETKLTESVNKDAFSGDFIPLTGTEVGSPVTGTIVISESESFNILEWDNGNDGSVNGLFPYEIGLGIVNSDSGKGFSFDTRAGHIIGLDYNVPEHEETYIQKKYVDDNFAKVGTVAPISATDTGTVGEIRVTPTFIYTCVATDTWVRAAVETW